MPTFPEVDIRGDSKDAVAYALFMMILRTESVSRGGSDGVWYPPSDWILSTYWECLRTVMGREPES